MRETLDLTADKNCTFRKGLKKGRGVGCWGQREVSSPQKKQAFKVEY